MPRQPNSRPKPKSKQKQDESKSKGAKSFLGEESTADESAGDGDTFLSADLDNQTDYGLGFSTSPRRSKRSQIANSSKQVQNQPSVSHTSGTNVPTKKRRKQLNPEKRERKYWDSVKALQRRTDNIVPKAPFGRLIREILIRESTTADRLTVSALRALQESAEFYLTALFQDAYCCTIHRGRVTLSVKDIELTRYLRGAADPASRK